MDKAPFFTVDIVLQSVNHVCLALGGIDIYSGGVLVLNVLQIMRHRRWLAIQPIQ